MRMTIGRWLAAGALTLLAAAALAQTFPGNPPDAQVCIGQSAGQCAWKGVSGDVGLSDTGAATIQPNAVTNGKLAPAGAQNTVKGAAASTAEADLAVPSCSTANSALQWTANTGFNCNANAASLNTADQTVSGGANVTSQSLSTGNVTIDCGSRPLQFITNNGAYTITAPSNDGSCLLLVTNGASAGATSFSGFSVGSNTGDALTTTNTNKFTLSIWRINGVSGYRVAAHQ